MANSADLYYQAYLTTHRIGGDRTPVAAERIVLNLGEDSNGNMLELSIDLTKRSIGEVIVSALIEPSPCSDPEYLPQLKTQLGKSTNALRLVVSYRKR
ncbi:hypothetical protein Q31b_47420 [Novipirellula aureliae]|uniref:Uncharacterized protein n=1 Tax=Novipirellula aureliae TaxID=2527966 RepID=A0A5C6DKP6_9BACT|nr:hypothetical protein Q31b_47420 [Novipirellula aureliae]